MPKSPTKAGRIKSDNPSSSIRDAEERPDLNNFLIAHKMVAKREPKVEKGSLPDHLYNPYIYIKKVIKKQRGVKAYEHPEIWNTSTNPQSKRDNKNIRGMEE